MSFYKNRYYGKTKEIPLDELQIKFANKKLDYITLVVLFGSRADGSYHLKSDYDFAIATNDTAKSSWGIASMLWNDVGDILDLPECDYDIVHLNDAKSLLLESIKEKYIVIKGNDDELQRLFNRND